MWVSHGLQRALSKSNIEGGFWGIGIWPFNEHVVDNFLGPSRQFHSTSIASIDIANHKRRMQDDQQNREDSQNQNDEEGDDDLP